MFNQDYWRILFSCIHRAVNSPRSKNKCLSNHCSSSVDLRFLVHSTLIWSGKFHSLGEYDWWPSAKFLFFWFSNLKHKKWNFFTLFMNKSAQDIFVFRCTIWDLNFVLIAVSIQIDRRDILLLEVLFFYIMDCNFNFHMFHFVLYWTHSCDTWSIDDVQLQY